MFKNKVKKNFIQSLRILILVLIMSFPFMSLFAWNSPSAIAPNSNTNSPIVNGSNLLQIKGTGGGVSTNPASILRIKGATSSNGLAVLDGSGTATFSSTGTSPLIISGLSQSNNMTITNWPAEICIDGAGSLILCGYVATSSYPLTVSVVGTGNGNVTSVPSGINCTKLSGTCNISFSNNESVALTASPSSGSTFSGWSGNCSGTGTCVLSMTAARSATATFNITSSTTPVVVTTALTQKGRNTATGGGNVTSSGGSNIIERGVAFGTSPNPTILGSHTSDGTGLGIFSSLMTGLTGSTNYYYRAYATNLGGTTGYGEQILFTTLDPTVPTVTTLAATNIAQNSATGGGNITATGGAAITASGLVWSIGASSTPTLLVRDGFTTDGLLVPGNWNSQMNGLATYTTYSVRAYATNSGGTGYGSKKTFTTLAGLPTVTTSPVTNITNSTATTGGNVISDGGASVTEKGIAYGTSANPTSAGPHIVSGTGIGSFTTYLSGLSPNVHYYVRAYAKNSGGTSYGDQFEFTTGVTVTVSTAVTNITAYTAKLVGTISNAPSTNIRGFVLGSYNNPTINGVNQVFTVGSGNGAYFYDVNTLSPGTTYYARGFSSDQGSNLTYGNTIAFTTLSFPDLSASIPTPSSTVAGNITFTSTISNTGAASTGTGTFSNIFQISPTTIGGPETTTIEIPNMSSIAAGGTRVLTTAPIALAPGIYFNRVCADQNISWVGSVNEGPGEGNNCSPSWNSFQVTGAVTAPTLTTLNPVTSISQNSATGGGTITANGGSAISVSGLVWIAGTTGDPTLPSSLKTTNGLTTLNTAWTSQITGLSANTNYRVRAYATNSSGLTGYGSTVQFKTNPTVPIYALNASIYGYTSGGSITSTPAGINCGSDCTQNYDSGTVVSLVASPNSGAFFDSWQTGACSGTNPVCSVTMNGTKNVAAVFSQSYLLTVTKNGTGLVTSNPSGINCGTTCTKTFNSNNATVTLSAISNSGSTFLNWSGDCSSFGSSPTCTLTMSASKNAVANFNNGPILTVSKNGSGTGSVTSTPSGISCGSDCTQSYDLGTPVSLSATPSSGSMLSAWSGCNTLSGVLPNQTCNVNMNSARNVTATFITSCPSGSTTYSTPGSGTFLKSQITNGASCSANVTIELWGSGGGGGGGGGAQHSYWSVGGGGGGGAGGYVKKTYLLSDLPSSMSFSVGTGGAGGGGGSVGQTSGYSGEDGIWTTFNNALAAYGGGGGGGATVNNYPYGVPGVRGSAGGGEGINSTIPDLIMYGDPAVDGTTSVDSGCMKGGNGGDILNNGFGTGGAGGAAGCSSTSHGAGFQGEDAPGLPTFFGGGGGGGGGAKGDSFNMHSGGTGGNGANGRIKFSW